MVTPIYAGILGLIFFGLSVRTIVTRRGAKVSVGDGGDVALAKVSRAHANFAEYVPLCLILLYFMEQLVEEDYLVHALGLLLVFGRLIHAYGISQVDEDYRFRVFAMVCTFIVLVGCSVRILVATMPL